MLPADPARQQRSTLIAVRDGTRRVESRQELLTLFVVPLYHLFGERLSARLLQAYESCSSSSSSAIFSSRLSLEKSNGSTAAAAAAATSVVEAAQEALLLRIVVDWQDTLVQESIYDDLVCTWLFGIPGGDEAKSVAADPTSGQLQQCSIRVMSRILSSWCMPASAISAMSGVGKMQIIEDQLDSQASNSSSSPASTKPALHPLASSTLIKASQHARQRIRLASLVDAALQEGNQARREIAWSDTLRLLGSFPDRVANFTRGGRLSAPDEGQEAEFNRDRWFSDVFVRGLADMLVQDGDGKTLEASRVEMLAEAVVRLDKLGWLTLTPRAGQGDGDNQFGFWPTLLTALLYSPSRTHTAVPQEPLSPIDPAPHLPSQHNWHTLLAKLPRNTRCRVRSSLVRLLDHASRQTSCGVQPTLVSLAEKTRPGREGSAFLSARNRAFVAAASGVLSAFLDRARGPNAAEDEVEDDDDDDDDDGDSNDGVEEVSGPVDRFVTLALKHPDQTPLMAWVWTAYLSTTTTTTKPTGTPTSRDETTLPQALKLTLDMWSRPSRIATSTVDSAEYLCVQIVTLLAATTATATAASSSTLAGDIAKLSRSPAVLEGVSRHLEHPDPVIRRLGMLVAEEISAAATTVASTATNASVSDTSLPTKKALCFGRGVWDGSGAGKEEARVLRALLHAWSFHVDSVRKLATEMTPAVILDAFGITPPPPLPSIVSNPDSLLVSTRETEEPRPRAARPPAQTRRLPERVHLPSRPHAPSQSRSKPQPLITMIDDDDDNTVAVDADAPSKVERQTEKPLLAMFGGSSRSSVTNQNGGDRRIQELPSFEGSEDDSSNDANSSDDDSAGEDEEGRDEIQKLAAELSGLGGDASGDTDGLLQRAKATIGASTLGGSTGKKGRNRNSKLGNTGHDDVDFDRTRESHAPTFAKKTPAPVYISQLVGLLKSSDRGEIKLGLRWVGPLVRCKSGSLSAMGGSLGVRSGSGGGVGFGNEVLENAVELTLALVGMHNTLSISRFEEWRLAGLVALLVGCPVPVASVVTEQVFGSQYSIAQRHMMLQALAEAAHELALGTRSLPPADSNKALQSHDQKLLVETRAQQLGDHLVSQSKAKGEDRVPAIRREKSLLVDPPTRRTTTSSSSSRTGPRKLVELLDSSASSPSWGGSTTTTTTATWRLPVSGGGRLSNGNEGPTWTTLAGPSFVHPLINRFLSHFAYLRSRSRSRQQQTRSGGGGGGGYAGANMHSFWDAQTTSMLLDTLSLMVDGAVRGRVLGAAEVALSCLELLSAVLGGSGDHDSAFHTDLRITASGMTLLLVVLSASWESEGATAAIFANPAPTRRGEGNTHLPSLLQVVHAVFQHFSAQQASSSSSSSSSTFQTQTARSSKTHGLQTQILARSASILLLAAEIDEDRSNRLKSMLGFSM
ncbi:hypothetical protein BCV70DRAFT_198669 [Testicularia cyperi]|uniref:Telomere length regulation protein conserved domain-containing protein n=1 Tax=Testicularia cyperi TaxID=1882483 RepID=A0A317XYG1_9BASI|nr:hypothetical protein BCV70DRAFT_198669 [Testicularia cyperi]